MNLVGYSLFACLFIYLFLHLFIHFIVCCCAFDSIGIICLSSFAVVPSEVEEITVPMAPIRKYADEGINFFTNTHKQNKQASKQTTQYNTTQAF
jgi:hypothetical protein